jgi:2-succinyl-6-hydroxy-2,4-cyclohexadiene-1-carboxylate synthase
LESLEGDLVPSQKNTYQDQTMQANQTKIVALHGFLGEPSDFDFLGSAVYKPDYLSLVKNGCPDFASWAQAFEQRFAPKQKFHLVGYSMGGRFALEYAVRFKSRLTGLSLISVNLNQVSDESQKLNRAQSDQAWAKRFLNDDLTEVIQDWNNQPVFAGTVSEPYRNPETVDRELMSVLLTQFSVLQQRNFFDEIKNWDLKIDLFAGQSDKKYLEQNQGFQASKHVSSHVIQSSGHRIIFDNPKELSLKLTEAFVLSGKC